MDDEDYWIDLHRDGTAPESAASLRVSSIENVAPLEQQLGKWPKAAVPEALWPVLFAQPVGEDAAQAPLRTYALLDGAKVDGLAETLEDGNLDHACLFKGDTLEAAGHLAPWLICLDPDDEFTRRLFTASERQWDLWNRRTGIFLRSTCTTQELRDHLRRFTYVQNAAGRRIIFRFWDTDCAGALLTAYFHDGLSRLFEKVHSLVVVDGTRATIYQASDAPRRRPFQLSQAGTQRYLALRQEKLCDQLTSSFAAIPEFHGKDPEMIRADVRRHVSYGVSMGISDGADLFRLALGIALADRSDTMIGEIQAIHASSFATEPERRAAILAHVVLPIEAAKRRAGHPATEAQ